MVGTVVSLMASAIFCVESTILGFSVGVPAEKFSPTSAAQMLMATDEVFIGTFGTDMESKRAMMMDVQAYIDAVSFTSETPTVKATVIDKDKVNEKMRLSLSTMDEGFIASELEALSSRAGDTEGSINDFLCATLSYPDEDFQDISLSSVQATAKGSLKSGKAVCMGYANSFTVLAEGAGIRSVKVRGYIKDTLHVVNVVDGGLVIDVTWNDKSDNEFFLIPISEYCDKTGFVPVVDYQTAFEMKYGVALRS